MTAPWSVSRLGDAGQWLSGGTPSKGDPALWSGPVPWVSPKDMKRSRIADAIDHVSSGAVGNGTQMAPMGSLLMVVRGMILAHTFPVAVTTAPVAFNQDIKALVPSEKYTSEFLLYWLGGSAEEVLKLVDVANHGTKRLPSERLFDLTLPVPPLPEQRKIAAILSSVDDAIDKTQAVIDQLAVVKKAMMQDLLTKGLPGRHKRFKQTEIGMVPEDWAVRCVEEFAQVCTGDKDTKDNVKGGIYPFIVRSQTLERIDSYSFDGEAVLTAGDGVGTGKVFHYMTGKFDYHQRVYNIHSFTPEVCGKFFFYYFQHRFIDQVRKFSAKNSVDSVRRAMITRMAAPVPPLPEQRQIADMLSVIDNRTDTEAESLTTLRQTKSALMSVLLTGELRVSPDEDAA